MVQHLVDPEQPGRCIHASGGHLLRWHGRRARRVEAVVEHGPRHPREPGLKNHQNQNNQNQNEAINFFLKKTFFVPTPPQMHISINRTQRDKKWRTPGPEAVDDYFFRGGGKHVKSSLLRVVAVVVT